MEGFAGAAASGWAAPGTGETDGGPNGEAAAGGVGVAVGVTPGRL